MKKLYLSLLLMVATICVAFSQVPRAFNYQAVVRNSSGEVLSSQSVSFKISILRNSASGTVVYSEQHQLTTNAFGLANFEIGNGNTKSGTFSPEGWGASPHFVKIDFDPEGGSAFSHLATSKFISVPYAFYAENVTNDNVNDADYDPANEIQTLSISGTTLTLSKGGGTVTLPTSGGGDNWGTQKVVSNTSITGDGTNAHPLSVVADGDGDNTNEIQTLSINSDLLTLSEGGGTVALPKNYWKESIAGIYVDLIDAGLGVGLGVGAEPYTGSILNGYSKDYEANIYLKSDASSTFLTLDRHSSSDMALIDFSTDGHPDFYAGVKENDNFIITSSGSILVGLEIEKNGNTNFTANIKVNNELHSSKNGDANMMPIAYGTISSTGSIYSSSGNISVSHPSTGRYEITITNENFFFKNYIVTATIIGNMGFIYSDSGSDKLIIHLSNTSNVDFDGMFSFVVYEP